MKRVLSLALAVVLFMLIAACQSAEPLIIATPDMSFYALDPTFRPFYNYLGGKDKLGEAISDVYKSNGKLYQYTEAGLLMYDENAPVKQIYQLAPLGKQLNLGGPTNPDFGVADPFRELYEKLGPHFVGQPLTGLVFNSEQNRYEQYFENLGFYHGLESSGDIRLLPYGAWVCDAQCRRKPLSNAIIEMPLPTSANPGAPTLTAPSIHEWSLLVQESYPILALDQEQRIDVEMLDNARPVVGAMPQLILTMPDGSEKIMTFPPTSSEGKTHLDIQSFGAPNGTLINYKVCITTKSGDAYCMRGGYLIWKDI